MILKTFWTFLLLAGALLVAGLAASSDWVQGKIIASFIAISFLLLLPGVWRTDDIEKLRMGFYLFAGFLIVVGLLFFVFPGHP